ncbi:hypothetical protein NMG60_11016218 [Bertholletia excelsa]
MATYYTNSSNQRDLLPNSDLWDGDSHMFSRTLVTDGEQNLRCQGLSLSLGTQVLSGVFLPSLISSQVQAENGSPSKESVKFEYFSNNPCYYDGPNEFHSSPHPYEPLGVVSTIFNIKYLKTVQQLLSEVLSVDKALKQFETEKLQKYHEFSLLVSKELGMKFSGNSSELSPSEQEDLQNKLAKLLSMLDEVDRRYRQYCHQMQTVTLPFETVAGLGAAKPYTTLALKSISRQFRSLRDAINRQIHVIREKLGEQGGLPRLRYVDQHLGQHNGLQQFGAVQNSWRPQRGLPETSVSILRAWLFEHFLHPYPKDSEKLMLAKQTGLTRSQVANWFINARVRLWKPMVEEMYKEEFGEEDLKSSPKANLRAAIDESCPSEDGGDLLRGSVTTKAGDNGNMY